MTSTSWRTLAGILTLAIGGFVVLANDKPKILPAAKSDCSRCPSACCDQCPCAQLCQQARCAEPCCPPAECPCPAPADVSPVPCQCPTNVFVVTGEVVAVPPPPPGTPIRTVAWSTANMTVPYRIRMEMIGAVTQIELLRGEEVTLRVQCDRVDIQMPGGGVQAIGKVCVSSNGLDVRCNRMTIGWNAGEICMEGQVQVNCQHGQQRTQMSSDCINCRLNSMGTGLDFTPAEAVKTRD